MGAAIVGSFREHVIERNLFYLDYIRKANAMENYVRVHACTTSKWATKIGGDHGAALGEPLATFREVRTRFAY